MRYTAIIVAALLSLSVVNPIISNAEEKINYNDMILEYREESNGELTLVQYNGNATELEIPEKINGFTVTAIADNIFSGNEYIKNITLPDTVNYFGVNVFRDSELVSINIPKSLQFIPNYTFNNCQNLETVIFHDNIVAISNTAFKKTDIDIPDDLKEYVTSDVKNNSCEINVGGFSYFLHDGECKLVGYIGNGSEMILPENLKGIPITEYPMALTQNSNADVTSVTFPKSMTNITIDFFNLPSIRKLNFLGSDIDFTSLRPMSSLPLESLEIFAKSFNASFKESKTLKNIRFTGNGDLNIASEIFSDCSALESVEFSAGYDSVNIPSRTFANCGNIEELSVSNAKIAPYAFQKCGKIVSADFGGATELERFAFLDCKSLENINIDTSLCTVDGSAFAGCISLESINNAPVFDGNTGDFSAEYRDFIMKNFKSADDVGFINSYVSAQVRKIVSENISDDMSDIEKVRILHDWVCEHTKYGTKAENSPEYHNDASIFMNDETVCEGYARLCNLLYHEAGLETYYVGSHDHAWNIVKIGGHWFHVDSTWDDGDTISRKWFMKSDSYMKSAGGSHAEWETSVRSSMHDFQTGDAPECRFDMGDVNTDGEISVADLVKMSRYLLGADAASKDDIVLYDLDFSGKADAFDIVIMRKFFKKNGEL